MRLNEVMGIELNRRWGVCSLNDFRKVCSLDSYECLHILMQCVSILG